MQQWGRILIIVGLLCLTPVNARASQDLSIVSLVLRGEQVVYQDDFFEILDLGNAILIPIDPLMEWLELRATIQRAEERMIIQKGERRVTVNLGNTLLPSTQARVHNDQVFLAPSLLEYLAEVQVEWSPRLQLLTIHGWWEPEKQQTDVKQQAQAGQGFALKREPTVFAPPSSLGSVHFKGTLAAMGSPARGLESVSYTQSLLLHGRIGEWTVSAGIESTYARSWQSRLSLIRGRYFKPNLEIILGDLSLNLPQTLGQKSLRGVGIRAGHSLDITTSYTRVEGEAENGSKVTLFVNGKAQQEQLVWEEKYVFQRVPLISQRLNHIQVVIWRPDGEVEVYERVLLGTPRLGEDQTAGIELMTGVYTQSEQEMWQGWVLGTRMRLSPVTGETLDFEGAVWGPQLGDSEYRLGMVFGLAKRLRDDFVWTLDALVGGAEGQNGFGLRTRGLYGFPRGFAEGYGYQISPHVGLGVKTPVGGGVGASGTWDLGGAWNLRIGGDLLSPTPGSRVRMAAASLRRSWAQGSLRSGMECSQSYQVDSPEKSPTQYRLHLEYSTTQTGFGAKTLWSLLNTSGNNRLVDGLDAESDFYVIPMENLALGGSLKVNTRWNDLGSRGEVKGEGFVRWRSGNTYLSGRVEANARKSLEDLAGFPLQTSGIHLELRQEFSARTSMALVGKSTYLHHAQGSFQSISLQLDHALLNGGKLSFDMEYRTPMGVREAQLQAGVAYTKKTPQGFEVSMEARRLFSTIYTAEPIYRFSVSVSKAWGFAEGFVLGQAYQGSHSSFVAGTVFLDENGNGVQDPGEEPLSGVQMALDGRRVVTDAEGVFRFENVRPGIYALGFDLNRLDARFDVGTPEQILQIRENENLYIPYSLSMHGSISGQVFMDRNASGVRDADEKGIQWVGVQLEGRERVYYTRQDGSFYIDQVPLGEHKIRVLTETLPEFTQTQVTQIPVVVSKKALDIEDLVIPVVYGVMTE